MFNIFNTKTKNLKKLALVSGAMIGAMAIGATTANASTKLDQNHVRVEQGDTLSQIAFENGTTVEALAQANHLTNPDMIFVGDNLVLTPNADNNNNQSANVQNNVQPASQATNKVAPAQATNTTNNQASQTVQSPVAQPTTNSSLTGNSMAALRRSIESGGNYNTNTGSVHDQFIAAGGNEAMWNAIVIPESGGNPNASNGQYSGLGQTNQSWGTGSVAEQTQGMINYANSRYGSVSNAINFRMSHNFW